MLGVRCLRRLLMASDADADEGQDGKRTMSLVYNILQCRTRNTLAGHERGDEPAKDNRSLTPAWHGPTSRTGSCFVQYYAT
jgi:hypothetical protein